MAQPHRQELINNAVLFLLDPKVSSSSLTSRITFLEGKGLNESEIQEALRRAQNGEAPAGPSSAPDTTGFVGRNVNVGAYQGYAPEPPRRDWRDLFIMAVISGGVVYGLTALARKYLVPHLRPPTTTSFQQTSSELNEQYDQAAKLLTELTTQTTNLQESLEGDRDRVNKVVEEVEEAVRSVRDGEERWREEMRDVRGEVESIRELVPRMIEKHAAGQSAVLGELKTELRSLKIILQSRQSGQSQQTSPAANGSAGTSSGPNGTTSNGSAVTSTQAAANALLAPKKGGGIPAWQKAPTTAPSSSSVSEAGLSSGTGSLSSSGVLEPKETEA